MPDRHPKQRATISDVAKLAGVSISTVSRVVNDTVPVSGEVNERVRSAIEMLNYTPHVAARNLAVKKTNTIGLLLPELSSSFFGPLLRGIENALRQTDYDLLVYANAQPLSSNGARRRQPIGEHNADGMIVFTTILTDDEIRQHAIRHFPLVLLYHSPPRDVNVPHVMFDNRSGMVQVVDHLVQVHGRRHIAFLRGTTGNEDSHQRELAFREALSSHGIPFDPELVAHGGFKEAEGEAAVQELWTKGKSFDAIFTGDDEAAAGVLVALRQAGLRVPQDVSVVGFDDIPFARHLNPPLTTVRAPIEETGYQAAMMLFQILDGTSVSASASLPVELVIRQSCGCKD